MNTDVKTVELRQGCKEIEYGIETQFTLNKS